jgi:hypothetical protein
VCRPLAGRAPALLSDLRSPDATSVQIMSNGFPWAETGSDANKPKFLWP